MENYSFLNCDAAARSASFGAVKFPTRTAFLKLASFDPYFGQKTIQKTLGDGQDPFDFSLGSSTGKINATASTISLGRILDPYA
jgi:hypothetical protein